MVLRRGTTFMWSLTVVILVVAITASGLSGFSTKQDSGVGLSIERLSSKTDISSLINNEPLQQSADKCLSSTDCRNGGVCSKDKDGNNYCQCKNGTSGDICDVVDDCVRYPLPCGLFKDVQCVYDVEKQKAKCKCSDDTKKFDSYLQKCRVPCTSSDECPRYIVCKKQEEDEFRFCRCLLRSGGDRCSNHSVNQCQERGLDCGSNPNVTCENGPNGPVCYCKSWSEGFNYQAKDCLKCNCEASNLGCQWFPNGTKQCYCEKKTYQEDEKCKDCKCGAGALGCKLENGKKKCDCYWPYEDINGVCEDRCVSNTSCKNGGLCSKDEDGNNYCRCKKGTSGDTCDVVDDCVRYPMLCGLFKDVQCVYDLEKQKARCKCDNESKEFDSYLEKCRAPCNSSGECPSNVLCRRQKGDESRFCRCHFDSGGDRCSDHSVNQCQERGLDCGSNPNVTCEDGPNGPVCYCQSWSEGFNYKAKDCLKCDCEGDNLGCQWFPNGTKQCYCEKHFYQEGEKCKDCKCGVGSDGCQLENGKKKCDCFGRYQDNDGVCELCYCGVNQVDCTFENKNKTCSCKPGYLESNGTCRKNCDRWGVDCEHGGKCVNSVCKCLPGTSGDVCEVIKGCEYVRDQLAKCGHYSDEVSCDFNVTSLEPYCRCHTVGFLFDTPNKRCKSCYCGEFGRCYFVGGNKTCDCDPGYSVKPEITWRDDSKCERCICGGQSISCFFTNSGIQKCLCEAGYSQKGVSCEPCDCGENGECTYDAFNRKQCDCDIGYVKRNDFCTECDCGTKGKCEFDEKNEKKCICDDGYAYNGDKCEYCGCVFVYGETKNSGYTKIDCIFKSKYTKTCLCPEGYKEDFSVCRDINECLNRSSCPAYTSCKNTPGNYTCSCISGYRPFSDQHDPKIYGCMEINECVEKNACPYRDTSECVHTSNGYYCRCKSGYSSLYSSYTIEMVGCDEDQTGWKVGYIILIVVFIIASASLIVAIKKKKS